MTPDGRPAHSTNLEQVPPRPGGYKGRHLAVVRKIGRGCGFLGTAIGGTYLVAWLNGSAARWSAAGVLTMKTNMALSLLLAGVALVLLERGTPSSARMVTVSALGSVVLLVGGLTLSEHLFRADLGIDQLLVSEAPGAVATVWTTVARAPSSRTIATYGAATDFCSAKSNWIVNGSATSTPAGTWRIAPWHAMQ